ncbi:Phage-related protein [Aerococcus viridans]|uniref:Addiction module toxin RelE n=2 Tax=Aerococcus viridans TaxID=1377 RepID=A0AAU8U1T3_9LACT|nr:type II toxin-antitoxin system RelE/ParE family toxin [Aerococcus viridans]AMC00164.1 addiction module toxin RelE [Aerococcus viridans]EFG49064.1 toxin-antitoxin system, toxin component, RelE family [Aerococcus viridans ATCC 11563 = CCUG 4311]GMR71177.1 type II toxin-antitoxin system RelE/ParE family toxin [Aerococcus viridans]SUU10584.1 Phage-related protein [Aerococcus viridans]
MVNKKIEFEFFDEEEFKKFLDKLPSKDAIKVMSMIDNIEIRGIQSSIKNQWVKKLDDNLFEIRSKSSNNIQRGIYFHVKDSRYIITHFFTKKDQKTPKREIERGKNRRKLYFVRRKSDE